MSFAGSLRSKIIEFQKKILELKQSLQMQENRFREEHKRMLLDQIEWFEALDLISEDLKAVSNSQSDGMHSSAVRPVEWQHGTTKAVDRLKLKMQRQFSSLGIEMIMPHTVADEINGIKIIEAHTSPAHPEGTVLEVLRPGYKWHGQILRKAEVITARN
jgi:molecular chaperone GrpE (heat shock protein)